MADGKHEAIIDEKIFYEAQKKGKYFKREKRCDIKKSFCWNYGLWQVWCCNDYEKVY